MQRSGVRGASQFDDGHQAVLNALCTCGAPAQVVVYLRDCKIAEQREARKREALAGLRCASCAGKDPMAKPKDAPEPSPAAQLIQRIAVADIEPDPDQPRKHFDTVDIEATLQVKEGMAVDGRDITHPVQLIKAEHPPYRIKDGERRWRAATHVGLLSLPAYFVPAAARESILEDQLRAGLTAQGLRPLEIADAISLRLAMGKRKPSAEDLAPRVGLSNARQVHRYRVLASVAPPPSEGQEACAVRKALEDRILDMSVALEIATIADPAKHSQALDMVKGLSLRQARDAIKRNYHLALVDCGFDPTDGRLPGGKCEACPKNTSTQRSLWADDIAVGKCTDKECFDAKREATWEHRKAKSTARIVEGEAAKKLYPTIWMECRDESLIELDTECRFDADGAIWREVLGGAAASTLVRDEWGRVHELVEHTEATALARDAGREDIAELLEDAIEEEKRTQADDPALPARHDKERRKTLAAEDAKRAAAWTKVLGAATVATLDAKFLRFLCGLAIRVDKWGGTVTDICNGRGIATGEDAAAALASHVAPLEDVGALLALLVELLVRLGDTSNGADSLETACRFFGIEFGMAPEPAKPQEQPSWHEQAQFESSGQPQTGFCRVCGCSSPDADWADPAEMLCSECAGRMQEIMDLLQAGSNDLEGIVSELGDEERTTKAVAEMLRTGEIADNGSIYLVPVPATCKLCEIRPEPAPDTYCESCSKLKDKILKLCDEKPRQGPQIKAACRDWHKDIVHKAIKTLVIDGSLDKDSSGFSTVRT
jgi:ParB family transcriptional regulator, chromosome partitioning protein